MFQMEVDGIAYRVRDLDADNYILESIASEKTAHKRWNPVGYSVGGGTLHRILLERIIAERTDKIRKEVLNWADGHEALRQLASLPIKKVKKNG